MSQWPRPRVVTGRGFVVVFALSLAFGLLRAALPDPLTDTIENRLLDLRFQLRGPLDAPETVTIVALDDRTVDGIGMLAPMRAALSQAIAKIDASEPEAIGIDLLFFDHTAADTRLATTLSATDNLTLAVIAVQEARARATPPELQQTLRRSVYPVVIDRPAPESVTPQSLALPVARLAQGARLGHVNLNLTSDAVAREMPAALAIAGGNYLPALPVALAQQAKGLTRGDLRLEAGRKLHLGAARIPLDPAGLMTINHLGPGGTVPTVSVSDVLDGSAGPNLFRGRTVLIGSTAESLRDQFATPFSADVAGVEILATATANLIDGRMIRHDLLCSIASLALMLLTGPAAFYAGAVRANTTSYISSIGIWAVSLGTVQAAFAWGNLWLDATSVLGALIIGTSAAAIRRFAVEQGLRLRVQSERENLSRFVPPALADMLARAPRPAFHRRPQNAAVLFADVIGYTTAVELVEPVEVAALLSQLHAFYEDVAERHGGFVADYQGDGAMIAFGLPEPAQEDAAAALACARELLAEIDTIETAIFADGGPRLRVGLHFGRVAAAVLGGDRHGQVGVTGDTVNVTARLLDAAKSFETDFITTAPLLTAAGIDAGDPRSGFVFLDRQTMRGRQRVIAIYGVRDRLRGKEAG